jgi:hypothetical protein
MNDWLDWLVQNKEWLFSGVGVAIIVAVGTCVRRIWSRQVIRGTKDTASDEKRKQETSDNRSKNGRTLESSVVFFSGSKLVSASHDERQRFTTIARELGKALGRANFGIVGCPPHSSRVLASVEAMKGLTEVRPMAPTSYGAVSFPLDRQKRARFAKLAGAAIFVGGSRGRPSKTANWPCPLFGPPDWSPQPSNRGHYGAK